MSNTTFIPRILTAHDLGALRKGILDARRDFPRLLDFYSGHCAAEQFSTFLALGDMYTDELTRRAWKQTMFKEIDRVERLFLHN